METNTDLVPFYVLADRVKCQTEKCHHVARGYRDVRTREAVNNPGVFCQCCIKYRTSEIDAFNCGGEAINE